jgi:hypothetical protein
MFVAAEFVRSIQPDDPASSLRTRGGADEAISEGMHVGDFVLKIFKDVTDCR